MKTAVITGGSSGIGRSLALELARRGYALGLTARRLEVLEELRDELTGAGAARVEIARLDVTDTDAVHATLAEVFDALGSVDLVVANAGVGPNHRAGTPGFERSEGAVRTNLIGAMATVDAAVARFRQGAGGHIVAVSSIAAFRGMPGLAAYSASKAGLAIYMEGVRAECAAEPITVTTLSPGYIDTPLNEDVPSRPFLVSAEEGAKQIADLIESRVENAAVPRWPWGIVGFAMRHLGPTLWQLAMKAGASGSKKKR